MKVSVITAKMKFLSLLAVLTLCLGLYCTEGRKLDRHPCVRRGGKDQHGKPCEAQQTTSAPSTTDDNSVPNDDHMFTGDEPAEFKAHVQKLFNLWPLISGIQFSQVSNASASASINFNLNSSSNNYSASAFAVNVPTNFTGSNNTYPSTSAAPIATTAPWYDYGAEGDYTQSI